MDTTFPKHPNITVKLTGRDSNAFMILGLCRRAAKAAGLSTDEIETFYNEASSGSFDQLLVTVMRWFSVE
ncbi:hypothetical protein G7B40_039900 [Aetokthonos hydrillicola Thurmond2011]|jgi:nucleoside diphosphate kinase|uniref:Uncharacterized protein n=1 Tax=Aetokthonos hydrillicola Thurmond2011 TaxID=2712845 RepID=A0AAP5IFH2_9CYAN|nr:hypothetical protein [Aetokthonos hydrillicola]MBW4590114.1 hypothetical protein [Aetokthonos hydrillicola CCALA 1050]MDR9900655.1 hypothetical protein [Aetokthonos hydrillicola Thurmond2011]